MKLKRAALAGAAMFVIGLGHSFCLPTQFPAGAAIGQLPVDGCWRRETNSL